ncbi:MAG: sulfotransferase family 2 domain-containing protein [Saprospiraceae bacterium]|nr:sulfotransferase family 2 domain-containing protein [Saprospiraceae bacterium]
MKQFDSFIFTHIPKSGGTSFREFFYVAGLQNNLKQAEMHVPGVGGIPNNKNISQLSEEELIQFRNNKVKLLADHSRFNVHARHFLNMYNPFYFTTLREPVSRFISHYNFFHKQLGYHDLKGVDINDLPVDKLDELIKRLSNLQIIYCLYTPKPRGWEIDEAGFAQAKFNLEKVYGSFGILEQAERSVEVLKNAAPKWLVIKDTLPEKNKNIAPKSEVSPAIIEKIKEKNYYDLKLYDFALELFEKF